MTTIATARVFVFLCLCTLLLLWGESTASAQIGTQGRTVTNTDSTKSKIKQVRPGFDLPDSLYVAHDSVHGDIDTIVRYTAKDSTVFDVAAKRMTLVNNSTIQFQNRELDAYKIVMDFQANTLTASSYDYDSVISSSLAVRRRIIRDTNRVKKRGAPILKEGATPYEGEIIVYNFKTKRGTVQLGTSEMDGGFYYGEKIKQVAPQTLFVENGRYTTCDAPVPHYYFESPKMKVVAQDQVFAEPIYLYVADVPIFALPFAVLPNHSGGRHSGLIVPNYQTTGDRGYGLTHLGYYQVFSDYFDIAAQTDLYTKGGYNVEMNTSWMKRYLLSSAATLHLAYGHYRANSVDPFSETWEVNAMLPNMELGVNSTLNANLLFASNKYFQKIARSQQDLLTQRVNSRASYSKSWEDLGVSLDVGYERSQDLNKGEYDETSPSISLNKTTIFPFSASENADPTLSTLGIGYSMQARRQVGKHLNRPDLDVTDTTSYYNTDQIGVLHSPQISIAPKLGHFTLSPRISYSEAWLFRSHKFIPYLDYVRNANGGIDTLTRIRDSTMNGFHRLYTASADVGLSTTLYGIANVGAFGVTAIRHTVIPSVNLSYRPSLASEGEVQTYTDPRTNQVVNYDLYAGELNAGLAMGQPSAVMSFGINNDFEAKVQHQYSKDSVGEDKVKLLNMSLSSGYDLLQKVLSQVSVQAYSTIGTRLNVHTDLSYSFYPATTVGNDSIARTLIALKQGFLRPISASFGLDGSFTSSETTEGQNYDSLRRLINVTTPEDERTMLLGGYYPGEFISVPFRPKWSLGYGISYSQSRIIRPDTTYVDRNVSANAHIDISLTKNWSFTTYATYDLVNKRIVVPELRVHRDLHCWEMNFSYSPPGNTYPHFNFEIRIKAPQLQDIKLTRSENSYGEF